MTFTLKNSAWNHSADGEFNGHTEKRPLGRPNTPWRDYVSWLPRVSYSKTGGVRREGSLGVSAETAAPWTSCRRDFLPLILTELCILLNAGPWLVSGDASALTYEGRDPISGRAVQCDRCPPGTFLRATCSSVKKSECSPCPQGSFTELWNYIGRCLRCGVCGRNQVVKKACTADSDCQCECKEGYFYDQRYETCLQHKECPSGSGVLAKGTPEKDTVCSICSPGTFSNISSTDRSCAQHRNCSEAGLVLVLKGSTWHDNVCANCGELKDGATYLKEIIPAFFMHHPMKIQRLRRIVQRLPSEDGKKQGRPSELSFSKLHSQISSWVSSATPEQIRQLSAFLLKTKAIHAGEKLQRKLNRIVSNLSMQCDGGR
ncbi:tumor necrosis factor receptor superfamily member 6B-like [Cyprinodon tularosa]|uniref:tumor necrosis factor receptor superfamily member 6B-like n=1 Tax=Cyprinodon tularosa TaxID=77115 RepID=UPI0018E24A54|nr:tumor necrosis factor receptor superfamily member 6B-like [Cyprinodon tularosa]